MQLPSGASENRGLEVLRVGILRILIAAQFGGEL